MVKSSSARNLVLVIDACLTLLTAKTFIVGRTKEKTSVKSCLPDPFLMR